MPNTKKPLLSNAQYDVGRNIVQYVLPGFGTLYFTLSGIWGFPYGEEVVGTCAALAIFLGVILGLSNYSYEVSGAKYDGAIAVKETEDKTTFDLVLDNDPHDLTKMDEVIFKIEHPESHIHRESQD